MARIVTCRECRIEVELPAVLKEGKRYSCPDCGDRLPVKKKSSPETSKRRKKPASKRRKRKPPQDQPFWKTKTGKILSGLGFLVLGIVVIGYALTGDVTKPIKLILGGVCAILVGLGGLGYGFMADDSDSTDSNDSEDEDFGGGDWGDD